MNVVTRKKLTHHALALAISATLSLSASTAFAADADRQIADGTTVTVLQNIETNGEDIHALHAINGGNIDVTGADILTTGTNAYGMYADGAGSVIRQTGGSITASGTGGIGALANDGARVELNDANLTSSGHGISVSNGGSALINNSTVTSGHYGIAVSGSVDIVDSEIRTTATFGARGILASSNSAVRMTGGGIATQGNFADGVWGLAGSNVSLTNTSIATEGNDAYGIRGFGQISSENSQISTTGANAVGIGMLGAAAQANLVDVTITTDGDSAHGIQARTGSQIDADGVVVNTQGDYATALLAHGAVSGMATSLSMHGGSVTTKGVGSMGAQATAGATMQLSHTDIDARGTGVQAADGSRVDMSDVTVVTHEGYAHGIEATGTGALVTGSNVRSTTEGEHAYGLRANNGGLIDLDSVTVNTSGVYAHGAVADTAGSSLTTRNTNITTTGDVGMGARAFDGGMVDIADASVTTSGNGAYGLDSMTGGSVLNADNVRVETFGTSFGGTTASAVVAEWGGQLNISNSDIVTHGASSIGLLSQVGGSAGDPDTILNAHKVQVLTSGENAFGAMACSLVLGAGDACASPIHSGTATDGARALLTITDSTIQTTGTGSHGLYAYGPAGAALVASGSQVLTTGDGAHGAVAEFGANLQLVNSQVRAEGVGAVGADVIGSTLGMAGGSLFSAQDSAIRSAGGDITLAAAAQISAGNGVFLEQIGDDASTVRMQDDVIAAGDIVFGSGATTGATTLQLSNDSAWIGKTVGVIDDLSIASGSRWQMTGDSQVGQLSLDHGIVAFDPTTTGTFKTLTVSGDFNADNGLLLMNTALGDDHSGTDKLHVLGNTSGTAAVAVNNVGGLGAETQDGIQIIEVDGRSDARFDLSGRAVAGQYEYFLYQGGKNDPNDGDWYLRSEMSPVDPGTDPGTDPVIDPPAPVQRPEGGAYLANQAAAVGMFDLTLHERVGEPNLAERQRSGNNLGSVWVRTTSDHPHYRINDQLAGQGRQSVLQIGTDLTHWGSEDRGVLGVMAANGQSRSQVTSDLTGYSAQGRVNGRAVGVYATWIQGAQNDGGLYVDSWLQAARFKNSVQGDALAQENYRSRSTAASLEAGYAMRLTNNANSAVYLEPQVQAIWTDYRMEGGNHQEVNGTVVSKGDAGGLQTRVGARLYGHATAETGNRVQPFVAMNWIRNPSHANSVWMDQTMLEGVVPRDVYEAKAGVQLQLSPRLTGWGELNTQRGAYGFSSMGAQMGVKYAW